MLRGGGVRRFAQLRAPLKSFLEENGLEPCEDNQLVLKRTFTTAGANRQFVNGSPTTLNVLATIGEWLVDMHGPHDHQSLLHAVQTTRHSRCVRRIATRARGVRANWFAAASALEAEKAALIVDEKTYAQQLDLLRFQVNEISAARLQPGEENASKRNISAPATPPNCCN